jgi:hypothetical protein
MTTEPGGKYRHVAGYLMVRVGRDHRLSTSTSVYVYEHRLVLFEAFGEGPFHCYICNAGLDWDTLTVDHLNDVRDDNRIENLKPACDSCNQQRGHWKTRRTMQAKAKRYAHDGLNLTARQWDEKLGLRHGVFQQRLLAGKSPDTLFHPGEILGAKRLIYELGGEKLSLAEWAARLAIAPSTILHRLRHGWSLERALTTSKSGSGGRPPKV